MEKFIGSYLSANLTEAITHTLLHSVWQGMLLVIVASLLLRLTQQTSAQWRYQRLMATLLLFTLVVLLTFILELNADPGNNFNLPSLSFSGLEGFPARLWQQLNFCLKYLHEHAGLVALLWLVALGIQICRLSLGFYVLGRMRVVKVIPVKLFWQQRLNELARDLGIAELVELLESGIAKVPLVIGYLKPLILIPVGLLSALDQPQVEAILLHELAHIRRKDGLLNLVQTLMETLLFFNPAVWWLSALIRLERENCCDDIAVQHLKSPIALLRAMVHFEQYRERKLDLALAFSSSSAGIAARMERLLTEKTRKPRKLDLIAIVLIMSIGVSVTVLGPRNQIHALINVPLSVGKPSTERKRKALEDKKRAEADALRRTGRHAVP